jgi:hypothetical protein
MLLFGVTISIYNTLVYKSKFHVSLTPNILK